MPAATQYEQRAKTSISTIFTIGVSITTGSPCSFSDCDIIVHCKRKSMNGLTATALTAFSI